jgi:alpha-beta hydrolase superfamily lysophospholipase
MALISEPSTTAVLGETPGLVADVPNAAPVWLGPEDRPLFGWVHTPAGAEARAGVLMCPPFGHEYQDAYATFRLLAENLASRGFYVLRLDYDGIGDSAGDDRDPGRLAAWLNSVAEGVAFLRRGGAPAVVSVGMRLGALLAAVSAERDGDIDGLVLWDPVASGRAYLAEQRALGAFSFNKDVSAQDGLVEAPGITFYPETVTDLKSLDLSRSSGVLAKHLLVLTRSDRSPGRLASRLEGSDVQWAEAVRQAELMEAGGYGVIAYEALDTVADWIALTSPTALSPVSQPPRGNSAVVARTTAGAPVIETPVLLGPTGLVGIITEPACTDSRTTILFPNVSPGKGLGPDRLWVDLARRWAAAGLRSCRLQLSGCGDSPVRHQEQGRFVMFAPEAFDDVLEACSALSPDDPSDVVLIGHCASAYQALDSAFNVNPRGVIAVNPGMNFRPPEKVTGRRIDPRRRVLIPRRAMISAYYLSHYRQPSRTGLLHKHIDLGRLLRSIAAPRYRWARWVRESIRALARRLSWSIRVSAVPGRRPSIWLSQLVGNGVDVLLICAKQDVWPVLAGVSQNRLHKLHRTGKFNFKCIAELEHTYFSSERRASLTDMIEDHVTERFGSAGAKNDAQSRYSPDRVA